MDIMSLLKLLGGLALFIYGMSVMGDSLERVAGSKLEKTLEKVAGNIWKSILMGLLVTVVIQSSSGTTVMVIGFVNAGIMTLRQSVGIILGANIGTTITAQILRMENGSDITGNIFMQLVKPANFAYIAVLIGVLLLVSSKVKKRRDIGLVFIGFGILFIGMSTMEASVKPLAEIEAFRNLFLMFSNPIVGVLIGALVTALIQSSSASVGILQAFADAKMITYSAAIPIILGQNIGTCITAILSSLNGSKNAKRAACIHFYFNFFGTFLFLAGVYGFNYLIGFSFWNDIIDKGGIANFHTIFNITTVVLFIPFNRLLVSLAEKTFPYEEISSSPLVRLDARFLNTPEVALEQCAFCVTEMAKKAEKNFNTSIKLLDQKDINMKKFNENEKYLDKSEVEIARYLLSISGLSDTNKMRQLEMQRSLLDFEKIGDYSNNIITLLTTMYSESISLIDPALHELKIMSSAVSEVLALTKVAYDTRDEQTARKIEPLEDVVDSLKEQLRTNHFERLNDNKCSMESGHYFTEIVNYLEKISDHCSNIGIYIIQQKNGTKAYNTHSYSLARDKKEVSYLETLQQFELKYLNNI